MFSDHQTFMRAVGPTVVVPDGFVSSGVGVDREPDYGHRLRHPQPHRAKSREPLRLAADGSAVDRIELEDLRDRGQGDSRASGER